MEIKLFIVGCIFFVIAMVMIALKKRFIQTQKAQKTFETVYSWVDTIWSALIIASIIMYFIIQAFKIPTGSMRVTLLEGDHLFATKFIYGFRVPYILFIIFSGFTPVLSCQLASSFTPKIICLQENSNSNDALIAIKPITGRIRFESFFKNSKNEK